MSFKGFKDIHDLEAWCSSIGLSAAYRKDTMNGILLVADGERHGNTDCPMPHFHTLWAIADGEDNIIVMQPLFFEKWRIENQRRERRVTKAVEAAVSWMQSRVDAEAAH